MSTTNTRGRGWAYTGAILGGIVSTAANIAHSFVPPTGSSTDWAPQPGAVIGSIVWPVVLFFAVEILARVPWPQGSWWAVLRFGGFLPIALVAGFVSYRHLSALLAFYGEDPIVSFVGPIAIDGLMVMATGALIVTGRSFHTDTETTATADAHAPHSPATTHSHQPAAPVAEPNSVTPTVPAHLLPSARFAATRHANTNGNPITAEELAAAINIPLDSARQLLPAVTEPVLVGTINGAPVGAR